MKWEELLLKLADEPFFRTGFLATSGESLQALRLQLSRWVRTGRLIRLTKGLYVLGEPYRKVSPHPFVLSNAIKKASYVSMHSALEHFGMIPEHVPTVTSITTLRPERIQTPLGKFAFRHVKKSWFHGYQQIHLVSRQRAFVAKPEKALLDLVYLTPGADSHDFLEELRLQNLEKLDPDELHRLAEMSKSLKLRRAVKLIAEVVDSQKGYEL